MQLDQTDRRILRELDKNSREALSRLAKRLKLPLETVRYRLKRFEDKQVILNYLTVFDGGRLGFYYNKLFLKLHNVDEEQLQSIIKYLSNIPEVNWVIRTDGSYDIGLTVRVTNPIELSKLVDKICDNFSQNIHSYKYSVNIQMDFLSRGYLTSRMHPSKELKRYSAAGDIYKADTIDLDIIKALAENSRVSLAKISKNLPIGDDAVGIRIRKLEQEKVIVRYTYVLNNTLLGLHNYYILIYFNALTREQEVAFVQQLQQHPGIIYFIKSLGEWDYELNIEVESIDQYRAIMMDLTKQFSEIIKEYVSLRVAKLHSYCYP